MRTRTITRLGALTLALATVALVIAVAVNFSSSAQAQVDCERLEYNGRIVIRCESDGTVAPTTGDDGGDSDGDGGSDDDGDADATDADATDDDASDDDGGDRVDQEVDEVEARQTDDSDSDAEPLPLIEPFEEFEDAVAENGVFEFDRDDRGGRRGVDDRRERAVAAAEAAEAAEEAAVQAELEAAEAAAQAAAEEDAVARAQAELDAAAEAEAEAAEQAAADDSESDNGESEVAAGVTARDSDGSGRGLGWLALILGLLALALFGFIIARRRRYGYDDEYDEPWEDDSPATPMAQATGPAPQDPDLPGFEMATAAAPRVPSDAPLPDTTQNRAGPLANLFPPLPADAEAPPAAPEPAATYAGEPSPIDETTVESTAPMPDASPTVKETVEMAAPVGSSFPAMPTDAEVAGIEVPVETVALSDLPPPPLPPEAPTDAVRSGELPTRPTSELPTRPTSELPTRQPGELPTRDPGTELSAGLAEQASQFESSEPHLLPGQLSSMTGAAAGTEPALPEIDLNELTQERHGE